MFPNCPELKDHTQATTINQLPVLCRTIFISGRIPSPHPLRPHANLVIVFDHVFTLCSTDRDKLAFTMLTATPSRCNYFNFLPLNKLSPLSFRLYCNSVTSRWFWVTAKKRYVLKINNFCGKTTKCNFLFFSKR